MAEYRFPVDRTAIMLFASAIGETNPVYWDEDAARTTPLGGVIAPPTFTAAAAQWDPDYGLRGVRQIPTPTPPSERPARARGEGDAGGGGGASLTRVLHAEERYEYFKPLHPGTTLRVSSFPGKAWEKEGRRGGTLRFSESIREFRDETGDLVLRATTVGVVTGKAVDA
jgi:N-terminal half of MaoC dehydratase